MTIIDVKAEKHPSRAGLISIESGRLVIATLTVEQAAALRNDLKHAAAEAVGLKEKAEEAERRRKKPANGTVVQGNVSGTKRVRIGDGDDGQGLWMALDDRGAYFKYDTIPGDAWHVTTGPFTVINFESRG